MYRSYQSWPSLNLSTSVRGTIWTLLVRSKRWPRESSEKLEKYLTMKRRKVGASNLKFYQPKFQLWYVHKYQICAIKFRGVARYFFFRSILMERHFDTFASEVWQNILLKSNLPKKCLKFKNRAPLKGKYFYFWKKKSFWYTWQFRSHFWISQGCCLLHLSVTKGFQSSSFPFWYVLQVCLSALLTLWLCPKSI